MFPFTFAGLLSTPAPSAAYLGIAFIALFAVMAVLVGPDYDQQNIPAKRTRTYSSFPKKGLGDCQPLFS